MNVPSNPSLKSFLDPLKVKQNFGQPVKRSTNRVVARPLVLSRTKTTGTSERNQGLICEVVQRFIFLFSSVGFEEFDCF